MVNNRLSSIKRNSDFLLLKKSGKKFWAASWLLIVIMKSSDKDAGLRLGVTTGKKVGNAVVRNKLKRWSKNFFREVNQSDPEFKADINVVFRPVSTEHYKNLKYQEFKSLLETALSKIK